MAVTSPNQDWIPAHPVERRVVRTYQDGLWGEHEYSRWPQPLVRHMWHVACIPSSRNPQPDVPPVFWLALAARRDWQEDPTVGVPGLGFLSSELRKNLSKAAQYVSTEFQNIPDIAAHRRSYGQQLCLVLTQCLDRMNRLPSYAPVAVAVGAHIQRVGLELLGLCTYFHEVFSRINSADDFSQDLLPVLGVFARDGATVQLATRVGLPVWFLQPITQHLKVWKTVESTSPFFMSAEESNPPMRHHPDELGAVANLTSNWVSNMVFTVTGQLCTSRLPRMEEDAAQDPTQGPLKSRRIELTEISTQGKPKPLGPNGEPPPKKKTRRIPIISPEQRHPARYFTPAIYVTIPEPWAAALKAAGTLAQPRQSVHYFFPPPFLLDSVHQYIHNAVRIREFCRLRLLDPIVSGEPLTIAEWRAALWGDYQVKDIPTETDDRRLKRKLEDKNGIARLFGNGAALTSYSPASVERLPGVDVDVSAEVAATDPRVRRMLLWEAHEVNFRCELAALDSALVPRAAMSVMERWGREAFLSGVWGEDASIASVVPDVRPGREPFLWLSARGDGDDAGGDSWEAAVPRLRRFLAVASQWPGCKDEVRALRSAETWTAEEFDLVQREVASLYVSQFASRFGRLPIPPVAQERPPVYLCPAHDE
ncbi:uncharacterized protein BXZ73DRAFT_41713 [Epithele typhae]|uniref:uncharacterized protein n=1 Tax=Epithele typhae TaxID=378194 RepID=UPI002008A7F7|nr:uncharacterized protein BXZ73DRAFT_41713 [Epithele typhae]KAH9941743.1 hypothetical protein BXZ73DRAFT_41713 [Epithele typhae]